MVNIDTQSGTVAFIIAVFISIALYNVLELNFIILATFNKRSGLYFWSFVVATWGIAFNAVGYLLRHFGKNVQPNVYATLILIGWCTMITGQSVVLYSRLHIVMLNQTRLRLVLIMIITNAVWLHLPIIVLVYGSNSANPGPFVHPYSVYEKIQLSVFFLQEIIISALYIWETTKRLRLEKSIGNMGTRKVMNHLIYVNLLVVFLDVSILALEFANLFDIQTAWKPLVYSAKLKLEFSILNRLVQLTRNSRNGSSYTRSRNATNGGVALETFNGERNKQLGDEGDAAAEYEVHVGRGKNGEPSFGQDSNVIKTTEITVHSHRRRRNSDIDMESLDGRSGATGDIGPAQTRDPVRGSASSASSEVQFAKFGN
ncbi:integral membrane protein [Verticillium alfalfae VaMs.102]|uniref:Integral membrane protein n=1 Tax=Verticillium alfalfae (strain VaMs.102 / ATCC MYA-4576 / FGSC 10136) TaxID=526221 RepID=C9SUJ1_VERA1|nr:integral membrane protein [Verticillium alfalfae VaMs.102]EEY22502.1 integral membrane protein [Verticillium alfalfae VaMs.102]